MEADLRLMLLSLGVIFLVWIVIDAYRRRPQPNKDLTEPVPAPPAAAQLDEAVHEYHPTIVEGIVGKPRKVSPTTAPQRRAPAQPVLAKSASPSLAKASIAKAPSAPVRKPKARPQVNTAPLGIVIRAKDATGFEGAKLHAAIEKEQLIWDEKGIYHRHDNNDLNHPVLFTLAQASEAGTFSTASRYRQKIHAIVLVQDAPGNYLCDKGLDDMLLTGHNIACALAGQMCRLDGKPLQLADVEQMKADLSERLETIASE